MKKKTPASSWIVIGMALSLITESLSEQFGIDRLTLTFIVGGIVGTAEYLFERKDK